MSHNVILVSSLDDLYLSMFANRYELTKNELICTAVGAKISEWLRDEAALLRDLNKTPE